jgi:phosphohistidine phosphatase
MKKVLILIRHAKAHDLEFGQKDFERFLMAEGVKDASLIGRYFLKKDIPVDRIVASPAERAASTAQMIAEQMRYDLQSIDYNENIYDASIRNLLNIVNEFSEDWDSVMLVGHNPAISYIAENLSGEALDNMVSAGVVVLSFENLQWQEISQHTGKIQDTFSPDKIREFYK